MKITYTTKILDAYKHQDYFKDFLNIIDAVYDIYSIKPNFIIAESYIGEAVYDPKTNIIAINANYKDDYKETIYQLSKNIAHQLIYRLSLVDKLVDNIHENEILANAFGLWVTRRLGWKEFTEKIINRDFSLDTPKNESVVFLYENMTKDFYSSFNNQMVSAIDEILYYS